MLLKLYSLQLKTRQVVWNTYGKYLYFFFLIKAVVYFFLLSLPSMFYNNKKNYDSNFFKARGNKIGDWNKTARKLSIKIQ